MEVESKVSVADFSHNMFWVLCYVMCVENDIESALYYYRQERRRRRCMH